MNEWALVRMRQIQVYQQDTTQLVTWQDMKDALPRFLVN